MISRDTVRRTLERDSPPRIPRHLWLLPWAENHHPDMVRRLRREYPDDLVSVPHPYRSPLPEEGDPHRPGIYVDEWGCRFANVQDGMIGIVQEARIQDWNDLEDLADPEATLDLDVERVNAFCRSTDRFVLAASRVRPFERLGFLRTLERVLVDLLEQPPGFRALLDRVHRFYLREMEAWASTEVDALCVADDWGSQHGLMIAPDLFRRVFKPLYRDYAEIAHRHGKYLFMHSDGHIAEIIPDLIEVGVDALNCQIHCMGVEALGARFRGRITFWGEIDRQHLLPYGSRPDIRRAVEAIREHLYDRGGVIAQCEFGPGARPENVLEVFRAWDAPARGEG